MNRTAHTETDAGSPIVAQPIGPILMRLSHTYIILILININVN